MKRATATICMVMLAGLMLSGCKLEDLFGDELAKLARSEAEKAQSELQAQIWKQDEKQLSLEIQVTALQEKLSKVVEELDSFKDHVEKRFISTGERISNVNKVGAYISGEDSEFSIARTVLGPMIIAPKGVTPYLDGYKLKLWIGNTTSSTLTGAKIKISWGISLIDYFDKEKNITREEFAASQKSKEFSPPVEFPNGRYTEIEVVLAPAAPRDLKEIFIEISFGGLSLLVPAVKK